MKPIVLAGLLVACVLPTAAVAQPVALGLTRLQLEDADLVDAKGREIGEVERVLVDAKGAVTELIVEIDRPDPTPDHIVRIPLTSLSAIPDPDEPGDFDIQTQLTIDDLLALPATSVR